MYKQEHSTKQIDNAVEQVLNSPLSKMSESEDNTLLFNGEEIRGGGGGGNAPIGSIIAIMSNQAPTGFLICDGAEYQISKYPELTKHFLKEFGSINYFGGDGEETFAVPDLRGEFLRGTGTNSHTNCGNGAAVGIHQNGTKDVYFGINKNNDLWYQTSQLIGEDSSYPNDCDSIINSSNTVAQYWHMTNTFAGNGQWQFTSRPTNTSVLYCIKALELEKIDIKTSVSINNCNYSEEEIVIGQWVDGKPLYRKLLTSSYLENFQPNMTSNNTPSPCVVSCSSNYSGYLPWNLFRADNNFGNGPEWVSASGQVTNQWAKIDLGKNNKKYFTHFYMYSGGYIASDSILTYPRNFDIQGSNDNTNWDVLFHIDDASTTGVAVKSQTYRITNPGLYRYYRIYVYSVMSGAPYVRISRLRFSSELINDVEEINECKFNKYYVYTYTKTTDEPNSFNPLMVLQSNLYTEPTEQDIQDVFDLINEEE